MSYDDQFVNPQQHPPSPRIISFECAPSDKGADVEVILDATSVGGLRIDFEPSLQSLHPLEAQLVSAAMATVAAQVCLTPEVRFLFPILPAASGALNNILKLLYDAHAYAQLITNVPPPRLETNKLARTSLPSYDPDPRRTVLLWSGGKDSLAALLTLRRNGYQVYGLHARANFVSAQQELKAAEMLARLYDLPLVHVTLEWDLIRRLGRRYSSAFDNYPLYNAIPFGRDLILVVAGAIVARRVNAGLVCAGYETDLWDRLVPWQGRLIARHDVQSSLGGAEMNRLLSATLGVRFFSPIAGFREYRILRHLFKEHPSAWPHIESCFWGGWCGVCAKCARYQLVQRELSQDILRFRASALAPDSLFLARLSNNVRDSAMPFWEEQVFCLFELHRRGVLQVSDSVNATLLAAYPWYAENRSYFINTLERINPDGLAPNGFQWTL